MWKADWLPETAVVRNKSGVGDSVEGKDDVVDTSFRGGGITLTPLEPMRKWKIKFRGMLRNSVSNFNHSLSRLRNKIHTSSYDLTVL